VAGAGRGRRDRGGLQRGGTGGTGGTGGNRYAARWQRGVLLPFGPSVGVQRAATGLPLCDRSDQRMATYGRLGMLAMPHKARRLAAGYPLAINRVVGVSVGVGGVWAVFDVIGLRSDQPPTVLGRTAVAGCGSVAGAECPCMAGAAGVSVGRGSHGSL